MVMSSPGTTGAEVCSQSVEPPQTAVQQVPSKPVPERIGLLQVEQPGTLKKAMLTLTGSPFESNEIFFDLSAGIGGCLVPWTRSLLKNGLPVSMTN